MQKIESNEGRLQAICLAARAAMVALSRTKTGLIEAVKTMDGERGLEEGNDHILKFFCESRELVQDLADMIEMAECRHAIAMANVYTEDGELRPLSA